jgi:hypothetical protein
MTVYHVEKIEGKMAALPSVWLRISSVHWKVESMHPTYRKPAAADLARLAVWLEAAGPGQRDAILGMVERHPTRTIHPVNVETLLGE